jgi:hypothetical protein
MSRASFYPRRIADSSTGNDSTDTTKTRRPAGRSLLPLHERDLARLWEAGMIPPAAIVAQDGTPLQIVYRGRPNAGAGPDFRDAVIALPDASLLHGDIELHLLASDFRRHGHDRDPAYNRVVLHLVYRADDGASTALLGGRRAPVVALEPWLAARAAQIEAMLQQPALWREPCQTAIERLGNEAVAETLARLGENRLRTKAAGVVHRAPAVALYESLLRTLGHGPQQGAWLELSRRLPAAAIARIAALEPDEAAATLEALLLAAAGLLPAVEMAFALSSRGKEPGNTSSYLVAAWQCWRNYGAPAPYPITVAGPRRPANHPARRLAGLARLLSGGPEALLARARAALLTERSPALALLDLLTVEADGLWRERSLPWQPDSTPAGALIGRGKALELAINAILPVLLAEAERENLPLLSMAVLRAFHALPSPAAYGRTAHLTRALRSDDGSLIRGADRSQGALQLYGHYCTQGGCGRCPLS